MAFQTINPTTNELIQSFEEITSESLEKAVANATSTFDVWKKIDYKERAKLLYEVAGLLREKKLELSKLITLEMGKLLTHAEGEIKLSAEIFDYYAKNAEVLLADTVLHPDHGEAFIRSSPIGVLLGIEPWNFPFYQVARFAAPNLMIGNTILMKHASNVPQCALAIEDIFKEAGAPIGLYTNLFLSGKNASKLIADPRIKGVSLTGSEAAGISVATEAGKHIKKSVLELGGSDAFIILEDADIDKAVEWAVVGRINNNGQCCVASKRFIAVESIAEEFLKKFTEKMSGLQVGDPIKNTTDLGPLCSEEAASNIETQVRRAVDGGAKIILGGKRVQRDGAYMEPTILTDITSENPVFYEEFFGPVALFFTVKNEKEAIQLANDSPYGLGGSIFTQDIDRGKRIADQIDTGMVFINHPTWTQADLPFGGTKNSGYGREMAALGLEEFVNKKLIRTSELSDPF
ncbi:NAD-dependent succinate-semialdehyde dehydrogenase [Chryseobacterium chendengshani]|uniref:NAD-dependent succinate-semialdehyde dehydrogenase n=1 Tax=Chryseobacterium sp. LJ668 TaxID=2864040 RepID=UPI001C68BD25|nr:NAD-dependent succinate-semialdehyde dehydrogenase [Chryseobacterium sp. LJ668]MBW8523772.1 NAD-dependent succinate-semialdehyde dehydrogenase [Chryseobacterium sp. LJ668]QYK16716.1 NAD-dependent succinate-semialdehyde dehydrogenase [Chryseobacterium sp. LJ668]